MHIDQKIMAQVATQQNRSVSSLDQVDKSLSTPAMDNQSTAAADPFDTNAEPIMYMSDNRTPAITDIGLVVISIIFVTCILLLFILLPSIRRNKWRNFVCLSLMIIIGASIPISMMKNTWMVGELELSSVPYDSLYRNQFTGLIRVDIGLSSMNVSLIGKVTTSEDETKEQQVKEVHYNEIFHFVKPDEMQLEHQEALRRGLPYPILTVTEFFSQDSDGFNWTRQIRQAGFYTGLLLYVTFACWLVTMLLMCILPAYFMTMLRVTCLLSAASHLNYLISASLLSPSTITIYSDKLLITPNYMVAISTFCSIVAYYCAHYIDIMFQLQDVDQSLTIMDSEEYLNDKKVLDIKNGKGLSCMVPPLSFGSNKALRGNSVIIPISDIEEKFGMSSLK